MNVDIWKSNDNTEGSLNIIEKVINSTKTEVQNGLRALTLQVGKLTGKGSENDGKYLESLQDSLHISLEKVIANQELFLESCYRVQMDESQIETAIGATLEKLLDMFEMKMTNIIRDMKNLERIVKNHDSKTSKNLSKANANIVTVYDKTINHHKSTEHLFNEIKQALNTLTSYVKNASPKHNDLGFTHVKANLDGISEQIAYLNRTLHNLNTTTTQNWNSFLSNLTKYCFLSQEMIIKIQNLTDNISNDTGHEEDQNALKEINNLLWEIKQNIAKLSSGISPQPIPLNKKKCLPIYLNLIDVRFSDDYIECNETERDSVLIEAPATYTFEEDASNKTIEQTILDIFGKPPEVRETTTNPSETGINIINNTVSPGTKSTKSKRKCIPRWSALIDVRAGTEATLPICKGKKTKDKKQKGSLQSRFDYDYSEEVTDDGFDITTEFIPDTTAL